MIFVLKIGFLEFGWLDALDIALVAFLMYQIYFLVRGSLASRVFVGYLLIYLLYLIVRALGLRLLTTILEYFMSVGAITLIVLFQQEIRRFLLMIGKSTVFANSRILRRFLKNDSKNRSVTDTKTLVDACRTMSADFMGGLIIIKKDDELDKFTRSGDELDALLSKRLLLSIFNQYSPLHDGAVIVSNGRILAARCILPVSESVAVPASMGFRHRAALGMTDATDAAAVVVSEETGRISVCMEGKIYHSISPSELEERLRQYLGNAKRRGAASKQA